jgi:spore coat protein U-like protein
MSQLLRATAAAAGIAALVAASSAGAATATGTMAVTSTIQSNCTVATSPLAFGTYSSASTLNGSSTVSVTCTNTTPYNVGFDAGQATGATVTSRKMTNGAQTLAYALYQDAGHSTNWGNTVGTDTVTGTGSGSAQNINIYGQIASGQSSAPGSYSDTITVTVTY